MRWAESYPPAHRFRNADDRSATITSMISRPSQGNDVASARQKVSLGPSSTSADLRGTDGQSVLARDKCAQIDPTTYHLEDLTYSRFNHDW